MLRFFAWALALLCPLSSAALDLPAEAYGEQAEEVIVTASRAPRARHETLSFVTVISREDIARRAPLDLLDLLGRESGLSFYRSGGAGSTSGFFMRGASAAQSIVLIDGMRIGSATTGSAQLGLVPLAMIERIEIVRGAQAGIYGSNGIGGVVNIITKQAEHATGSVVLSYGSERNEVSLDLGAANEYGQIAFGFSGEQSDGIDHTQATAYGDGDLDPFSNRSGQFEGSFTRGAFEVSGSVLRQRGRSSYDAIFSPPDGGDVDPYTIARTGVDQLSVDWNPEEYFSLSANWMRNDDDSENYVLYPSQIRSRRERTELQADLSSGAYSAVFGFESERERARFADVSRERENDAIFSQWSWRGKAAGAQLVLRHDDNSAYGAYSGGKFAGEYRFGEMLSVALSHGRVFRAPTFNELFYPGFSNPSLRVERARVNELLLRGARRGFRWQLAFHSASVRDLIQSGPPSYLPENIGRAVLRGVELETSTRLARWNFSANVEYLDARDDIQDQQLARRPKRKLYLEARQQLTAHWAWRVDLSAESGRASSRQSRLSGFALLGLGGEWLLEPRLSISLHIANVLDADYSLAEAAVGNAYQNPGRNFTLTLRSALFGKNRR